MSIKRADYSQIAHKYDSGHVQVTNIWLELIRKQVGNKKEIKFLDLGCGTGRFAIPVAEELGFQVTGADNSEHMLEKAREKDKNHKVFWDLQDASSPDYPDNSFDAVFMSNLLHHIDNPLKMFKECFRILKKGGFVMNRTGTIEDNSVDPEHIFFPEVMEFDKKRTPTLEQLENLVRSAGFQNVTSQVIDQDSYQTAQERLSKTKARSKSVLHLISDEAFEKGVKKLEAYIHEHPDDPWLLRDKMTFTVGIAEK